MARIRQSSGTREEFFQGQHRFEHWYKDNQVYFITARCRERFPAFASDAAKAVFWDRFEYHTSRFQFTPWVTSLLDNHYHVIGYCKHGETLGEMMRCIHGSVAKLVNDLLSERRKPFWRELGSSKDYFDGCLRDPLQGRRTYRYTLLQSVRHGICQDHREYPHTRIRVEMERAIKRAEELHAFLEGVPYKRYERQRRALFH
jgi:REP element-mobilizing transposase RayT